MLVPSWLTVITPWLPAANGPIRTDHTAPVEVLLNWVELPTLTVTGADVL